MLLRKGRFIERRRVAYRLVGLVRGEMRVLSQQLYADAREAQAAVESAVPEDEPLEQVTLQRGEDPAAGDAPPDAHGGRWTKLDPLGCRWEVIKRWGPDVIARIRRQRFGQAAAIRFPAIADEPAAPTGGMEEAPIDEEVANPPVAIEVSAISGSDEPEAALPASTADAPSAEQRSVDEYEAAETAAEGWQDQGVAAADIAIGSATVQAEAGDFAETGVESAGSVSEYGARVEGPIGECADGTSAETPCAPVERVDSAPSAAIAPIPEAPHDEPVAEFTPVSDPGANAPEMPRVAEAPAAPIAEVFPAPIGRRRSRGAVLRTSAVVTLLLLAILLFETCSNPFAWLTGEAVGNEIRSLPFTNQPTGDAAPNPPAGSPALSARRP